MNKIGIIVSRVSSGAEILFSSEAAKQWQNEALDTRNYLKCIDIEKISEDKFDSTFFDFVTFGKDVAFICTNKYISGRDSDLISAMIVVPGFVDINGKELADILRKTKDILQETKRDDQKLEQICSIDYGSKQVQNHSVPSIDPNSEGQYAYRYYGSGTPFSLPEILGSIFQNYYCNYKAVLLIDAESGISPKEGLKDLTESDFKNSCILEYPKSVPSDIAMKVNGKLFTQNLLFDEGQQITLDISRKGCWPIQEKIRFDQPVKTIDLANLEWEVKVDLTWFKVYDKADPDTQIPSSSVKITINDKEVDRDGYNRFNIHELTSAIIVVDVMGFEEARFKPLNLLEVKQLPIPLPLNKQPKKYNYLIFEGCKVPNKAISFSFEATHYKENKSPLAGYKIDHFSNSKKAFILVKNGYGWKKIAIGLVVFLFACIGLISSCTWLYHEIFPKGNSTKMESDVSREGIDSVGQVEHSGNQERNEELFSQEEIEYLQTHNVWNLTEMEKISNSLKDLYEDVNTRKFLRIKSKWKEMLSNVGDSNCNKLLELAESKSKDGTGLFSEDGTITLDYYIKKNSGQGGNANNGKNGGQGGNAYNGKNGGQGGNANNGKNGGQGGNANNGKNGGQGGNANNGKNGGQGGNANQSIGGLNG